MLLRHKALFRTCLLLLLYSLFAAACTRHERQVRRGMYYWKTNVALSQEEQVFLKQYHCEELYVRFFDVHLDPKTGRIVPVAPARIDIRDTTLNIVPVVFITPAAIAQLDQNTIAVLAQNITGLLQRKCTEAGIVPKEIQIDCDWTVTTKEAYFNLLHHLKREAFFTGKQLSVTIRLHQVKYIVKSGIPPADKGLLMCYNMGRLRNIKEENSILNVATAQQYLDNLEHYPLPLDVALPVFHWSVLFEKEQYKGILRDIDIDRLQDRRLFQPQTPNTFTVVKDTFWNGFELKKGQWIRYENSPVEDVQKLATFVARHIRNDSLKVLLYHLDQQNLKNYTPDELEKIFTRF